jgi:hypothetical protein
MHERTYGSSLPGIAVDVGNTRQHFVRLTVFDVTGLCRQEVV